MIDLEASFTFAKKEDRPIKESQNITKMAAIFKGMAHLGDYFLAALTDLATQDRTCALNECYSLAKS